MTPPVLAVSAGSVAADPAAQIAGIVILSVALNWLAVRTRIPSILLLLLTGFLLGPVLELLNPDELLGDLLLPSVSMAVGLILFEGGLTLRFREIAGHQRVIGMLVSVGMLVTWGVGIGAALLFTDLRPGLAVLFGSILVVSGPTVIGPLLSHVRPDRPVGSILKWESIFIDPVGVLAAVVTFDVLVAGLERSSVAGIAGEVVLFVAIGGGVGAVVAAGTILALRRHWIPEQLMSLFGMSMALLAFITSDALAAEAGLLATTVLGMALANSRRVATDQIARFSEVVRTLLIGILFIVLSARLTSEQVRLIGPSAVGIVAVLVLIGRPLAAAVSTLRSSLPVRHRLLLGAVAPRGIVAAAIASVFGLELEQQGILDAAHLTPLVFAVIAGTVVIYGLSMGPIARRLGLARRRQEGALIVGAGRVERALAGALKEQGLPVLVATTNRRDEYRARMAGLQTHYGNVLVEDVDLVLDLSGLGRLLALTPNDDVNTLAATRFADIFGRAEVYQLPPGRVAAGVNSSAATHMAGRLLFGLQADYESLSARLRAGGSVKRTTLSQAFTARSYRQANPDAILLFVVKANGRLTTITAPEEDPLRTTGPGDTVIALIPKEPAS